MTKWLMDVTLKVKTDCELVNLIGEDTDLTIEDIRRVDGIYVSHLISISLDQVERFKELLSELNLKLEILNISKQKCFVCINKYSCTPL